jgi:hypothetical protein
MESDKYRWKFTITGTGTGTGSTLNKLEGKNMRYAIWDDGSMIHARNLDNVRNVKDLIIPEGAMIVDANSGKQADDKYRTAGHSHSKRKAGCCALSGAGRSFQLRRT